MKRKSMLLALLFVGAMMTFAACGGSGSKDGEDEDGSSNEFSETPKDLTGTAWIGYYEKDISAMSEAERKSYEGGGVEIRFGGDGIAKHIDGKVKGNEISRVENVNNEEYTYDSEASMGSIAENHNENIREISFIIERNVMTYLTKEGRGPWKLIRIK